MPTIRNILKNFKLKYKGQPYGAQESKHSPALGSSGR